MHVFCLYTGFVTDGEFNSLRTQGTNRPVSIIQLIMDSKSEARSTASKQIESFLKPTRRGKNPFHLLIKNLHVIFFFRISFAVLTTTKNLRWDLNPRSFKCYLLSLLLTLEVGPDNININNWIIIIINNVLPCLFHLRWSDSTSAASSSISYWRCGLAGRMLRRRTLLPWFHQTASTETISW